MKRKLTWFGFAGMTDEHLESAHFSDETKRQALRTGFQRTMDRLQERGLIVFTNENRDFGDESDHVKMQPRGFHCRFHPINWFHEIGCPHVNWRSYLNPEEYRKYFEPNEYATLLGQPDAHEFLL